ncbi:hypothetical protein [Capnocytophaga cynodegmi]|uniref:hypothetical protein n=1 Tax=Capnocytophaga cynodegmi TaxID=28189 RepID=UPI001BB3F543|nr:hypothetical protein [Capnocytophaga cynodegmi]
MKYLLNILKFPFEVCYCLILKPLAFKILEKEMYSERNRTIEAYKKNGNLLKNIQYLEEEIKKTHSKMNRIKCFIRRYTEYDKEVFLSENDELIFIFKSKEDCYNSWVYLCAENGTHQTNDSRIAISLYNNKIKINDFISNTNQRGYGRIFLNYLVNESFKKGIERIYGDLSPVDEEKFGWLIPFYESVGFNCILFNNDSKKMRGEIYINKKN